MVTLSLHLMYDRELIGVGHVYDVTDFLDEHPGMLLITYILDQG
jgi:hypothetical protein